MLERPRRTLAQVFMVGGDVQALETGFRWSSKAVFRGCSPGVRTEGKARAYERWSNVVAQGESHRRRLRLEEVLETRSPRRAPFSLLLFSALNEMGNFVRSDGARGGLFQGGCQQRTTHVPAERKRISRLDDEQRSPGSYTLLCSTAQRPRSSHGPSCIAGLLGGGLPRKDTGA